MKKFFLTCFMGMAAVIILLHSGPHSCPSAQELAASEVEGFILGMSEVLRTNKSMQVDFQQERHHSIFLEPLVSKGICFFKEPGKLRWEVLEPFKSLLLFNANSVAKYDFYQGNLRRLKLGSEDIIREVLGQITDWMKGDFSDSSRIYDIRIFKEIENYSLKLIPRSIDLLENIQFIELLIDSGTKHITQVLIQETETDFVRLRFFNEENNLQLDERLFDLMNPLLWIRENSR